MNDSQIEQVYTDLAQTLNELHTKRKRTMFAQQVVRAIAGLFFIVMLINLIAGFYPESDHAILVFFEKFRVVGSNPYAQGYPLIALIVLLYLSVAVFSSLFKRFKEKEQEAFSKMIESLFPVLEFSQNLAAPTREVVDSKLFASLKDDAPAYNFGQLRGRVENRILNLADIGLAEEKLSTSFGEILMKIPLVNIIGMFYLYVGKNSITKKASDSAHFSFRGMFCWLSFNKTLNGHTVILPNNRTTRLDRMVSMNFSDEQQVRLEDPRFTKHFVVYSTDQIEARYVLTTALMERIVTLKERFNRPILLSFQHQRVYIAVENENGLFSFPSGKVDSMAILEELAHDIETALGITKTLNLPD